ncbi:hypothetical protein AArcS_3103 [Natranaeroarchaeum sulfidigenes]|uniref:Uncharacterized protein n=1 Tax=Natranaeroarchaeum sulfidigenes TaxID=2784880 RepID=A0A897MQ59_9EURY|nr:hypothetical protein AArcS_3103 [Natranaeroarchaeum sulfidigenes]
MGKTARVHGCGLRGYPGCVLLDAPAQDDEIDQIPEPVGETVTDNGTEMFRRRTPRGARRRPRARPAGPQTPRPPSPGCRRSVCHS